MTIQTPIPRADRHSAGDYLLPAISIAIGVAYLVGGWLGDDLGFGVFSFCLMATIAVALLVVRRRSETVQGLMDRRDERINSLDLRATALSGIVVIVSVLGGFVVDVARGGDGAPYSWLGALGGVGYLGALGWLSRRS